MHFVNYTKPLHEAFPKLPPARKDNDAVEKIKKLPPTPTPKPAPQERKIRCPKCREPNLITSKFCSVCGWDLSKQFRVDPGFSLRK